MLSLPEKLNILSDNWSDLIHFRPVLTAFRSLFVAFLALRPPPGPPPWGALGAPRGPWGAPGVTLEVSGGSFWETWGALWPLLGGLLGHFAPPGRLKSETVGFLKNLIKPAVLSSILLSGAPLGLSLDPLDAP